MLKKTIMEQMGEILESTNRLADLVDLPRIKITKRQLWNDRAGVVNVWDSNYDD